MNHKDLKDLEGKLERILLWGLGGLCGSVFKETPTSPNNSRLLSGGLLRPPARRVEIHPETEDEFS